MPISAVDLDFIRQWARSQSAIVIGEDKEYLVEARLAPLAEREGLKNLEALITRLRLEPPGGPLREKTLDALTTNETLFFRDFHPFESLRKAIVPELIEQNRNSRRFACLSAACSTGQEPYSVAMMAREYFPELLGWDLRIIGFDLSGAAIARAREAVYSKFEINRGLPAPFLLKYFLQKGLEWRLKSEIKSMVDLRRQNLIAEWSNLPPLDLVFLRNVMIYFDTETKKEILRRVARHLRPGGYLLLGTGETPLEAPEFAMVVVDKAIVYRRV